MLFQPLRQKFVNYRVHPNTFREIIGVDVPLNGVYHFNEESRGFDFGIDVVIASAGLPLYFEDLEGLETPPAYNPSTDTNSQFAITVFNPDRIIFPITPAGFPTSDVPVLGHDSRLNGFWQILAGDAMVGEGDGPIVAHFAAAPEQLGIPLHLFQFIQSVLTMTHAQFGGLKEFGVKDLLTTLDHLFDAMRVSFLFSATCFFHFSPPLGLPDRHATWTAWPSR